ncbi:hypothetical protein [Mucilaginibacter pocheonensis]|uniref:SGNH domain-containing protein n=1 Tax=Mucilaginibacter pocheonensis TaxID=398050 RepID=A0ABU1TIH1_9SPHI|nr:hypothetical protein [Mucilaginibacter pocheonensis]MDR6945207.1 hypothetical protein [Mucilaginibacter pocheonensis]
MDKFLKNTGLFIAVTASLLFLIVFVPNYIVDKKSRFSIQHNNKIVLFGHSHPECAFNDSLIPNFKNLSHSAEPYFYTYQKVKKIISQNPQIETVLIEFSNNQINEKMNDWTWGYKYMSSMFPQYSSFMDKSDIDLLIKNNPKDFMNCMSISTRKNLVRLLTWNYNFSDAIGGYLRVESHQSNAGSGVLTNETAVNNANLSTVNIDYLEKIIAYCHACHKKVYLVRSPQHKNYEYLKNEKDFMRIKKERFADIDFLDFNNFPLNDDDFLDYGHLNYKGAAKFSKWFNKMLNSGLLVNKNKQALIDHNISRAASM